MVDGRERPFTDHPHSVQRLSINTTFDRSPWPGFGVFILKFKLSIGGYAGPAGTVLWYPGSL